MALNYTRMNTAEKLAWDFLTRVWGPAHDIDAIDEIMTPDYVIHSGGRTIRGRDAFKSWVVEFHRQMPEAIDEVLDVFANPAGDRVVARWINRGRNNGVFGLAARRQGDRVSRHQRVARAGRSARRVLGRARAAPLPGGLTSPRTPSGRRPWCARRGS